jgi:predicted DNA-binding transcriptional regulator AlpA
MTLLLDINEVAEALRVGRRTAYLLRNRPDFPRPVTLASRIVRYRRREVEAFVERLTADPESTPEPARLKAGKARKQASGGRTGGGPSGANAAQRLPAQALAERCSVELENARQK